MGYKDEYWKNGCGASFLTLGAHSPYFPYEFTLRLRNNALNVGYDACDKILQEPTLRDTIKGVELKNK